MPTQTMPVWLLHIREAFDRCRRHAFHEAGDGRRRLRLFNEFVLRLDGGHFEQTHHGTTDHALAAWWLLRDRFRGRVRWVRGVADYLVPDMDGGRTIAEPALAIERDDGATLYLTGCAWGYGGEGPHGTAAILCDLGNFADMATAAAYVASVANMQDAWQLTGGPAL